MSLAASSATKSQGASTFIWRGQNAQGKRQQGEVVALTQQEARSQLQKRGLKGIRLQPKPNPRFQRQPRIRPQEIAIISRQLATMLSAGVPLITVIQMLASSHNNGAIRQMLGLVLADLEAGMPLAQALSPHPKQFDALYCDLVDAGEQSGALAQVFDRIATYQEKLEALKAKIKKAMIYPISVIAVAIIVTAILLLFVVPQFEAIFASFNASLPIFTQLVIELSRMVSNSWLYAVAGLLVISWIVVTGLKRSAALRLKRDSIILKLPVVGAILHKGALARFSRTLATTFSAGVPLIEGLDSAGAATGNGHYQHLISQVKQEVISGQQLHQAIKLQHQFPDMMVQMVMIGEESGALDEMLNRLAAIYEAEVDDAVDGLSALIEPLLIVIVGTLVGGLVVAMYLPIFQLGAVVG
ncbi:type II secretion system F family protein [Ferrimonas aestuarii]|uniref:Type II secretion system F family protein n=1 Tax=Ferrimonas aestuarii TaxID=2569539 RepID=A0A4U1BMB6_9GAMM|nr:type II secretion system F family protein [Ferrimonas aestuarii]TKB53712.1 type II secretion system F family protein [Ferrimonas aestuarii]